MPLFADNARSAYMALAVAALVVAGLVLGKDVLVPLAVASCLAFILSPIVAWMTSRHFPRAAAVVVVAVLATAGIAAVSALFISQAVSLAAELGTYRANLVEKIRSVTQSAKSDGVLKRAVDGVLSLETAISREIKTPGSSSSGASGTTGAPPQTIVVETGKRDIWDHLGVLAHPLATVGLTFLFTLFMLVQTQDLRDRLVRVIGTDNIGGATAAITDAAERLSSLFLTQAIMNIAFGTTVGLLLWIIGVPNSILWGGLAIVMRFVPYVGSIIAAVPPVLLAAAVDPGWGMAFAVLMVFVVGEPIMGHVVEPVVLGPKAGLSPFAMLLSASFWAMVWGPIGLILAAPLTLTLVVLGRYVSGLEFLTVLLGDEPVLSAPEKFYHRLLAGDALGSAQHLDSAGEDHDFLEIADDIVLPALRIAATDLERGQLDREQIGALRETMSEAVLAFIDSGLDEQDRSAAASGTRSVFLLPARSDVDKAAAEFLVQALSGTRGIRAVAARKGTGLTAIGEATSGGDMLPDMIAIVTTGSGDTQYLPLIHRRATRAFPDATIAIFSAGSTQQPQDATQPAGSMLRITSARRLAEQISLSAPGHETPRAKAS